ncbi:LytR/AlgR family response regulator transcription factor [Parapedobacter tibetensis]|uniref:LytR/AlgR family response regulator transcription factor n=1 Tax=Parapedobacter tibetensis TaxID=2972951 RepID=UPI00214DB7F4|nr:LytTR family DNA-binding domain-containing protein [Parapedobacter tibetensis]
MDTIKAIIVDDEHHAIDSFRAIAMEACPNVDIINAYENPERFINCMDEDGNFDILFLDVEMVPYSGFKLLENLRIKYADELPFDVIFLTAYDQYAVQAFGYNALDYLLKPLMPQDLQKSICKWETKGHKRLHAAQLEQLTAFLSTPTVKPDRMAIPTLDGYEVIHFRDIIRCEADRNYTHIIDRDFKHHVACRTLKEVEHLLSNHGFIRVHHSHMINPNFVIKILKESGGTLEMIDHTKIAITKNREDTLRQLFYQIKKL